MYSPLHHGGKTKQGKRDLRLRSHLSRTNRMYATFYTLAMLVCIDNGRGTYKDILAMFNECGFERSDDWLRTRIALMEKDLLVEKTYQTGRDVRSQTPTLKLTEEGEAVMNRMDEEWNRMVHAMLIAGSGRAQVSISSETKK